MSKLKIDRAKFLRYLKERTSLFPGNPDFLVSQVQQIDAILDEGERLNFDIRWLAYVFGTVYHETGETMRPIEEVGKGKGRDYGKKLKYGKGPGKRIPYTTPDLIYYGRGHTQNTWYENYEALTKAAKKEGYDWDFLNHPELLLETKPSIWATFYGMKTGLYTGRSLSKYFNAQGTDWKGARWIINGQDKAQKIADYSIEFHEALIESRVV